MQASQALNGTYGLPATTERALSEADQAAVRSLYGGGGKVGSVEGRIQNNIDGNLLPAAAAHVWIEGCKHRQGHGQWSHLGKRQV